MESLTTVFGVLLALIALFALVSAARFRGDPARNRALGWLVIGVAAGVQAVHLLSRGYSLAISIVTTLVLGVGLWLLSRGPAPGGRV